MTGRLNTNGLTVTRVQVNASTHGLMINDSSTGTDQGGTNAATDENDRPTMFAVSESDGISPISLYVDSNGKLLVDSN